MNKVFEHYTYSTKETDLYTEIKTVQKVSDLDQKKLLNNGWLVVNDRTFRFVKNVQNLDTGRDTKIKRKLPFT